jgi:hypothetical protein
MHTRQRCTNTDTAAPGLRLELRRTGACRFSADDDDQGADKFCETQRMARTDDEKWLVVDGLRWRRTDLAPPADALDDSGRQDQGW